MNEPFRKMLSDYILSGHAYLHVPTTEKTRFLAELKELAAELPEGGRHVFVWTHATGWHDDDGKPSGQGELSGQPDPQKVGPQILDLPENAIFALKDFGFYVTHRTYSYADVVVAWLSEIRDVWRQPAAP